MGYRTPTIKGVMSAERKGGPTCGLRCTPLAPPAPPRPLRCGIGASDLWIVKTLPGSPSSSSLTLLGTSLPPGAVRVGDGDEAKGKLMALPRMSPIPYGGFNDVDGDDTSRGALSHPRRPADSPKLAPTTSNEPPPAPPLPLLPAAPEGSAKVAVLCSGHEGETDNDVPCWWAEATPKTSPAEIPPSPADAAWACLLLFSNGFMGACLGRSPTAAAPTTVATSGSRPAPSR